MPIYRYDRVVARIFKDPANVGSRATPEQEDCYKIIGWLVCAGRTLRWREIQAIFCIDEETGVADWENDRLRVSCKQLCGSLVDIHENHRGQVEPDSGVQIVHNTAREQVYYLLIPLQSVGNQIFADMLHRYLIRRQLVNITLEHAKAASFCFRYLTSPPFEQGLDVEAMQKFIKKGCYALQDYAVRYCLDHMHKSSAWTLLEDGENHETYRSTMTLTEGFIRSYNVSKKCISADRELEYVDIEEILQDHATDIQQQDTHLNIGSRTNGIRREIESLDRQTLTPEELETVENLYGPRISFKCPRIKCVFFSTGFDSKEGRYQHVNCHDRPFCCPEDSCFAFQLGFDQKERLYQHIKDHHSPLENVPRFPRPVVLTHRTLCNAASRGDVIAISAILDCGLAVDRTNRLNETPLYLAAKAGHFKACEVLLERGAEVYHKRTSAQGVTSRLVLLQGRGTAFPAVDTAVENRYPDIARLLLSEIDVSNWTGDTFDHSGAALARTLPGWIAASCKAGDLDLLRPLLDTAAALEQSSAPYIADVCRDALLPPIQTIQNHHVAIIKYCMQIGFTSWVTTRALFEAEKAANEEIVPLLESILNLPPSSRERIEKYIEFCGIPQGYVNADELALLQSLPPAEQRQRVDALQNRYFNSTRAENLAMVSTSYSYILMLVANIKPPGPPCNWRRAE